MKHAPSKITPQYEQLLHSARATGRDQRADLKGGARLSVRVEVIGPLSAEQLEQITLTIARCGTRVGDPEIITFRQHCSVPETAQRWPERGQVLLDLDGVQWHAVAFRWSRPTPEAEIIARSAARRAAEQEVSP